MPAMTGCRKKYRRRISSIEQASAGTPASRTTSAVPRADPFITAVPRSTAGIVNVSSEPAAAATASAADSQYAGPSSPITRLRAGPAVSRAVTEVVIAITHSIGRHLCMLSLAPPRTAR